MKNNKNNNEMIIYVSSLKKYKKGINEWVELDLMNPEDAKNKFDDFKKENEGHEFIISDTSMEYDLGVNELDNIDFILELAEEYFRNWSEEQMMVFANLINKLDFDWEAGAKKVKDYEYALIEIDFCETDERAVGKYYAEYLDIPDNIEPYFDYEKYGRDIIEQENSITTDDYVIIVY